MSALRIIKQSADFTGMHYNSSSAVFFVNPITLGLTTVLFIDPMWCMRY
jgi:hypothetical protein